MAHFRKKFPLLLLLVQITFPVSTNTYERGQNEDQDQLDVYGFELSPSEDSWDSSQFSHSQNYASEDEFIEKEQDTFPEGEFVDNSYLKVINSTPTLKLSSSIWSDQWDNTTFDINSPQSFKLLRRVRQLNQASLSRSRSLSSASSESRSLSSASSRSSLSSRSKSSSSASVSKSSASSSSRSSSSSSRLRASALARSRSRSIASSSSRLINYGPMQTASFGGSNSNPFRNQNQPSYQQDNIFNQNPNNGNNGGLGRICTFRFFGVNLPVPCAG